MGNYYSRPALSASPRTGQSFFPDAAAREREDGAFYEPMRFMEQEGIDYSDDESHTTTATAAPKKKRAMKRSILKYTLVRRRLDNVCDAVAVVVVVVEAVVVVAVDAVDF